MSIASRRPSRTHDVLNQSTPLVDYNLFETDPALVEAVQREGAGWAADELRALGAKVGSEEVIAWGFLANRNQPVLHTHDRFGYRIDEVEFHPAWHKLLELSVSAGIAGRPWRDARKGAHVARAAASFLASQNEAGHGCPVTMTYASVPALRAAPDLAAALIPKITSDIYDPRLLPMQQKTGVLVGMAMTEKQGGSDVRANTTRAVAAGSGGPGSEYLVTGHKWFCSAPMCDAFLMLATTSRGLGCFLLPRFLPDGSRNAFALQRLKDKLGNRSNASSEIEFDSASATLVGEEGHGIRTILEMASHTRLDCVIGSAALMRQALVQASHHVRERSAFGKRLIEQPLMQNVIADLTLESEAATVLALRLARAYDARPDDEREIAFRRIATPIAKYWVCKRAIAHVAEALECLGGNGFVEESILPRLYRESPINSLWEGSGNVMCLDVLRAASRETATLEALLAEIDLAKGGDRRHDELAVRVRGWLAESDRERAARRIAEGLALLLQGSLLLRHASQPMADAFCAARLGAEGGRGFGALPASVDVAAILRRVEAI
ncbi:MAG TPA: isovaleryl-CoA dehydrogenase [Polyangiaceae bacterium]|nr:isovaleryl-CoA dehydrogenase [Polyangiaceae bacterium]